MALFLLGALLSGVVQAGAIHAAAKSGDLPALQTILQQASEPKQAINEPDEEGYTALHWAVADGKIEIIPWLLKSGADITLRTQAQETPLLLAAKHGRPQTAIILIAAGADVNDTATVQISAGANAQDTGSGMVTAVTLAVEYGHTEVLRVLLDHGADVNGAAMKCDPADYCESPLWPINLAVRLGHRDAIKLLLARGAETIDTISSAKDQQMVEYLLGLGVKPGAGDVLEASRRNDLVLLKLLLDKATPDTCSTALRSIGIHVGSYEVPEIVGPLPGVDAMRLLLDRIPNAAREAPTLLHLSVIQDDDDMTAFLLSSGFDVNAPDPFGNTPLHWVALAGINTGGEERVDSARVVNRIRVLLDRGADINARNDWGNAPLHRVVPEGLTEVVQYFLDRGANVNVTNELGVTPLHMAALRGYTDIARLLLSRKANPNARMQRGTQPLHAAAAAAQTDMADLLIKNGADVNGLANHRMSPLHYALAGGYSFQIISRDNRRFVGLGPYGGYDEWIQEDDAARRINTVRLLVTNGAKLDVPTEWSATPLHMAVAGYRSLPVDYLEGHLSDKDFKSGYMGPLSMSERAAAVRLLMKAGASPLGIVTGYPTPLAMACGQLPASSEVVQLLAATQTKAGNIPESQVCANQDPVVPVSGGKKEIDRRDEHGLTLLHRAVMAGNAIVVASLLRQGANPNVQVEGRSNDQTPLHTAVRGDSSIVKLLLENGAQVNRAGITDSTPLHHASGAGKPENVKLLLEFGANPNAVNQSYNTTPLHWAIGSLPGAKECVTLLLAKGADPLWRDSDGKSPIDLARARGNQDILKILTEYNRARQTQPRTPAITGPHKKAIPIY